MKTKLHFFFIVSMFYTVPASGQSTELSNSELTKYEEVKYFVSPDTADLTPDQYPQYPGGLNGLMADVGRLVKYPERDRLREREGIVILKYIVEKDGTISDIEVEQSVSYGIDREAKRVVMSLRKWIPGYKDKEPVRVQYRQPFEFKLN